MKTEDYQSFPHYAAIVRFWQERPEFKEAMANAPCCFACRNGVHAWPDLQRAHIVAYCHGGSFEPSNFVLLCLTCHREAPMIDDRAMFLQWVRMHPHFSQPLTDAFHAILELPKYGITFYPEDTERLAQFIDSRRLRFHPHSTLAEKARAVMFLVGEYLKARNQVLQ